MELFILVGVFSYNSILWGLVLGLHSSFVCFLINVIHELGLKYINLHCNVISTYIDYEICQLLLSAGSM